MQLTNNIGMQVHEDKQYEYDKLIEEFFKLIASENKAKSVLFFRNWNSDYVEACCDESKEKYQLVEDVLLKHTPKNNIMLAVLFGCIDEDTGKPLENFGRYRCLLLNKPTSYNYYCDLFRVIDISTKTPHDDGFENASEINNIPKNVQNNMPRPKKQKIV